MAIDKHTRAYSIGVTVHDSFSCSRRRDRRSVVRCSPSTVSPAIGRTGSPPAPHGEARSGTNVHEGDK
jgi:hypothetical protein